jgi:hypothetical protein
MFNPISTQRQSIQALDVRSGTSASDLTEERAEREAGVRAMSRRLQQNQRDVEHLRTQYPVSNREVLSDVVPRTCQNLADARPIVARVSQLLGDLQLIGGRVAENIGDLRYAEAERALAESPAGCSERRRREDLLSADKQCFVSYEKIICAIEAHKDLIKLISDDLERAESDGNSRMSHRLLMDNAIRVYEIYNFAVACLRDFSLRGLDEINEIHAGEKERMEKIRCECRDLRKRAARKDIDAAQRQVILRHVDHQEQAVQTTYDEWELYLSENGPLLKLVEEIRKNVPTLELFRDCAKNQIDVLESLSLLRSMKQLTECLGGSLTLLKQIKLIPLTPERVRRLLWGDTPISLKS